MLRFLVISLTILICNSGNAQEVVISDFEKLSGNLPFMKILGKNKMGTLVYRFGHGSDLIFAYDDELNLIWKKSISFKQKGAMVLKNILMPQTLVVLYSLKNKKEAALLVQEVEGNFEFNSAPVFVDSLYDIKPNDIKVELSKDKRRILIYYIVEEKSGKRTVKAVMMDHDLTVLTRATIDLPKKDVPTQVSEINISNDGNIVIVVSDDIKGSRKQFRENTKWIYLYDTESSMIDEIIVKRHETYLTDMSIEFDNINKTLIITGFFTTPEENTFAGLFFKVLDLVSKEYLHDEFQKINPDDLEDLSAGFNRNKQLMLATFKVKDIIVRNDGGAIVVAESFYTTSETRSVPGYYPSMFYSTVTYTYYYFNDIIVFSIHPHGQIHWSKVIKKNQVSEGDGGFYSSYYLSFNRSNMHIIFNEDPVNRSNVMDYALNGLGKVDKKLLINTSTKDLMLIPKLGKQTASNEIIIPSIFRGKLRLVKFRF
ncbi:MAG: hypothetical protein IH946_07585 [Bacteroidetes bacterium]|nr:hypothetical protein [Bacteroidota bacterium]